MNKRIIAILFVALLFMGGVTSLLAEESQESIGDSNDFTEPSSPEPPPTLSGVGNGGGDPG